VNGILTHGALRAGYFLPVGQPDAAVFLISGEPTPSPELLALVGEGTALVILSGMAWNDLSPWPAAPVFGNEAFTGGAEALLTDVLCIHGELSGLLRNAGCEMPSRCILCGYSLAGLFSLWAGFRSACFSAVGSISGSLWFDGFADWLCVHLPDFIPASVYLSLGDREKQARNPRMARVEDDTRRCAEALAAHGVRVKLEMNPGGHFQQPDQRVLKGVRDLLSDPH